MKCYSATVVLGLSCLLSTPGLLATGNVGCFFDLDLCLEGEQCQNDGVFGRCHLRGEPLPSDLLRSLESESRDLLEREMRRLLSGGYRWPHRYTQCVLQKLLDSERGGLKYDPGLCARTLQLTIPQVAKEILRDLEAIGPEELALIRFRPSLRGSHSDFADELFSPRRDQEEEHAEEEEQEDEQELEDEEEVMLGQLLNKRGDRARRPHGRQKEEQPREEEEDEETGDELRALLAPLEDALEQMSEDSSRDDRMPDQQVLVVKTDLSSDLTSRPAYTEGGVQWLPVAAEQATQELFGQPTLPATKHVAPSGGHGRKQQWFSKGIADGAAKQQKPQREAFWKPQTLGSDSSETAGPHQEFPPRRAPLVQPLPEMDDLWRPVLEQDQEEEEKEDKDPDVSAFSRPMRYDIKKPGPGYYVHEPEEDAQQQREQMLALLQREQEASQWENFHKMSPGGSLYPENAPAETVNDEETTLQDLVRENMRSPDLVIQQPPKPTPKGGASPVKENKRERGRDPAAPSPLSQKETVPQPLPRQEHLEVVDTSHAYLLLQETDPPPESGERLVRRLERILALPRGTFSNIKTEDGQVVFKVNPNPQHLNASTVATEAEMLADELRRNEGLTVLAAGIGDKSQLEVVRQSGTDDRRLFILTFVLCGCVVGILLAVSVVYLVRRHARSRQKLQSLAQPDSEPSQDYQDLCRQRMQRKSSEKPEPVHGSGPPQQAKRVSSLSQSENSQASPSSRSSTSSWSEEPATSHMDISTGHMILSYMEDHLKNKDRLEREWEALCAYEAEPCAALAALLPNNANKNRYPDVLPYDHSRVVLNDLTNVSTSDYINASTITDHDPRNPAYIATQGPLPHTAADFWQMIWEQGSVVVVTLSRLMENGVALCHRYWPEEGSDVYHIYEVHLVSEHIWCDDYLVRSFYLKNLKTSETRTVTQFHFLSWPENGVPASTKALLEFRRKVNKSYRGRSCPIVVHCSDGSGRTGTYALIDMVLNRMAKGAKEIDIAATLEHIRDQRAGMVKTQAQFEFVLMAIAEEVHAILKALSN